MPTAGCRRCATRFRSEEGGRKTFFVRLVRPWNDVAFVSVPDDWIAFKDIPGGWAGYRRQVGVIRVPKDAERDFVIASVVLPDNSLLQVGRSADSRAALLDPVRMSFIVVGSATLVLGFAVGAFFAHRAMRPGPPDRRHGALHPPDRPARCARPRAQIG
jgi:hypothetical protein